MKNYGTIRISQNTAIGKDQSAKTKIYVAKNVESSNGDIDLGKSIEFYNEIGSEIIGYVTIIHPQIMWGSFSEVYTRFVHFALEKIIDSGDFVENDYGILFLKSEEERKK